MKRNCTVIFLFKASSFPYVRCSPSSGLVRPLIPCGLTIVKGGDAEDKAIKPNGRKGKKGQREKGKNCCHSDLLISPFNRFPGFLFLSFFIQLFRFFFVFPSCLSSFSIHTIQRIETSDAGRGRGCGWVY